MKALQGRGETAALVAGGILLVVFSQWFVATFTRFSEAVRTAPAEVGTWLTLLLLVAYAAGLVWVVIGFWRRSRPGCPYRHDLAAPPGEHCPRHAPVADAER